MPDDTTPAPALPSSLLADPEALRRAIETLTGTSMQAPTPPPQPAGDDAGTHGFAGIVGDIGNAIAGGSSGLLGLSPEQDAAAGRRALLSAGIQMLAASGPSYEPKNFGTVLARGLQGAMQSRDESERAAYTQRGAQQALTHQQFADRMEQIKTALPLLQYQTAQQQLTAMRNAAAGGGKPTTSISEAAANPFVYPNLPKDITPEEDQIVRTVYGEANGQPIEGQQGVAAVIKNRMASSGQGAQDVIFAKDQFEPWNTARRAQLEKLDPSSPEYQAILNNVVRPVMSGKAKDPTGGATHFYAPALMAQRGQAAGPDWASGQKPSAVIGGHNFYNIGYGGKPSTTAVARPATATAPVAPPTLPGAPPGMQMGGDAPPPPGGSAAAAAPYSGGGIGAALQPPKGAPVYTGGEPQPPMKGAPVGVGKLLPKTASAADAIVAGMQAARTGPQLPTAFTAGPGAPTQTATATPNAPEAGWGTAVGSYGDGKAAAPIAAPAAAATAPAQAPALPPPQFQMRPLTPTEQAQTNYDLDPATKANFAIRKQGAATPDQLQSVLKDEAAAVEARRKDADAARLTIENQARKDWQTQVRPATDQDLATANMQREPGVQYTIDNQGKVAATAIPVDPRATEASKAEQDRYQKNYAVPYDQTRPLRAILNEMDALKASVERDPLGGRGGITSEYARKVQQVLSGLGLTSDAIREGTSSQEAYAALSNQLILRLKAASGTSLGQMSDRDLSFIQSSAPNLSQTPQGREKIGAALRQIFDYQNRLYNAATDAIHDPAGHYTLRDLDTKLAAVPEAMPTLPNLKTASPAELIAWRDHHKLKRGMAYYGDDGQVHLFGVPEPAQGQ